MANTVTIYLKNQGSDLMWRNKTDEEWKVMKPDSATAKTTAGDTVVWEVSDDSIKKIKQIKVGKKHKISSGYKWKDIWQEKPKKESDTKFIGIVSKNMKRGDADGYEISVLIKNGKDLTVDPGVDVVDPPEKGEEGTGNG